MHLSPDTDLPEVSSRSARAAGAHGCAAAAQEGGFSTTPFLAIGPFPEEEQGVARVDHDAPLPSAAQLTASRPIAAPSARRGRSPTSRMNYIHNRRYLNAGEILQLDCDTQCNFMILADEDFAAYQGVRQFRYHGGTVKRFPARITVPESGFWNIIIDLNGATKEPAYNITVVIE